MLSRQREVRTGGVNDYRLTRYCLAEKGLLALVIVTGIVGFSVTFLFSWLIGSLIDKVINPQPIGGMLPTQDERLHHLFLLTLGGVMAAIVVAVAGWGRGH